MSQWVRKGLATGIKTTRYPERDETTPGVSPGLPLGGSYPEEQARELVARCTTGALSMRDHLLMVDYRRCVHCYRCVRGARKPIGWQEGYEWAATTEDEAVTVWQFDPAFKRSIHILVVDAGDCGSCLNEVRQLNNPYYNMHRLGFFITPTPREADVLLVVGPVTDHMREPLQKAYDAMPAPKKVIAVGACALSGSVFGPSFVCGAGVRELMPVDVEVPGQPPPPLAILHALLVTVGRKSSASLISSSKSLKEVKAP
jgi:Ni,Fe-hydrogenase III small subunit